MGACEGQMNIVTDSLLFHKQRQAEINLSNHRDEMAGLMNRISQSAIGAMNTYNPPINKNTQTLPPRSFMKIFRSYLEAHRDTIFTLVLILLVDHYVFKGAFAETIKSAFSKILDKAHKKIDEIEVKS